MQVQEGNDVEIEEGDEGGQDDQYISYELEEDVSGKFHLKTFESGSESRLYYQDSQVLVRVNSSGFR
jgi:hypothetical protein